MPAPRYRVDEELKKYATEKQLKYLKAVNEHRGFSRAAKALGLSQSTVRDSIYCLEKKAALCGYAPEHGLTHPVPSPFVVKGTSTLYDEKGDKKLQWVKTKLDDEMAEEVIKEFVKHLVADAKGLSRLIEPPKMASS